MKMLMLIYSGLDPDRISTLLDAHQDAGYTEFRNAHGVGGSGRREGSRAWPGASTLFVSVLPDALSTELVGELREEATRLPPGERLHVAVLPAESFF